MIAAFLQKIRFPGLIRPVEYHDPETGVLTFSVKTSPRYTVITVNGQEYYFLRENGRFDGTGAMSLDDPLPLNHLRAARIRESKRARVANGSVGH